MTRGLHDYRLRCHFAPLLTEAPEWVRVIEPPFAVNAPVTFVLGVPESSCLAPINILSLKSGRLKWDAVSGTIDYSYGIKESWVGGSSKLEPLHSKYPEGMLAIAPANG